MGGECCRSTKLTPSRGGPGFQLICFFARRPEGKRSKLEGASLPHAVDNAACVVVIGAFGLGCFDIAPHSPISSKKVASIMYRTSYSLDPHFLFPSFCFRKKTLFLLFYHFIHLLLFIQSSAKRKGASSRDAR